MLTILTELRPSPISGIGCFTKRPIAKDSLVWQFDSRFDQMFQHVELGLMPPAVEHFLAQYGHESGAYQYYLLLSTDNARFINHSVAPNLMSAYRRKADVDQPSFACRDIAAGEELTFDYRTLPLSDWHLEFLIKQGIDPNYV